MGDGIKSLDGLLTSPSFIRWVEGKADSDEAHYWDEWSRMNETNRKLAVRAQSEILGNVSFVQESLDKENQWKQFSSNFFDKRKSAFGKKSGRFSGIWWYRIAAVIIVAVSTGLLTYFAAEQQKEKSDSTATVWNHIETEYAESKKIALSDGSEIVLGARSSLIYPEGWINDRAVEVLLEGEAYFNISKRTGEEPAFKVKTDDGIIEVLGTRFVVDAEDNRTRVVLEEGAVEVKKGLAPENELIDVIQLKPNQMVEFNRSSITTEIRHVNPDVYISWKDNVLRLDNTSFRILADRIRKTFGIKVEVNNPHLYERHLTGELNMKSLDHLISAISEVLEIEVSTVNKTVVFG